MTTADASTLPVPAAQKPARTCKWMLGREVAKALLAAGHETLLEVDMKRADGELVFYRVQAIKDGEKVVGWRLSRDVTGSDGEHEELVYDLDCSFGPGPEHWECSCPDYAFRSRKRARAGQAPQCKHAAALHAALRSIGLA